MSNRPSLSVEDEILVYQKLCYSFKSLAPSSKKPLSSSNDSNPSSNKRLKISESESKLNPLVSSGLDEILIGINKLTRALEKDEVRLVVVSSQASPFKIIQHIPVLCTIYNAPLCKLNKSTSDMAKCFPKLKLKSVLCFGLKRMAEGHTSHWEDVYNFVSSKATPMTIDWLPPKETLDSIKAQYLPLNVKTVEHSFNKKEKRKRVN